MKSPAETLLAVQLEQPPTWRQPTADEPGGRRNPSYETECGECGTRLRITNNYSPQGDFLDQSSEPVGVAQERPQPPLHAHQVSGDWYECTDEHPGVAQERPPIDVERLTDAMLNEADRQIIEGPSYPKGWRGRAERLAAEYDRLGSVASPEPTAREVAD
jgi:hypothetical protein